MAGKNSPDFACGQILFSLKMSKLNYLVNETPYSVYITIRKKFMRDNSEQCVTTENSKNDNDKESELHALKDQVKDLETRLAMAKVDFEERDMEKCNLLAKISKSEDVIEDFSEKERTFVKKVKMTQKENEDLKTK